MTKTATLKVVKATSGSAQVAKPTLKDKAREFASKYVEADQGEAVRQLLKWARRNPAAWEAALKEDTVARRMLHALLCDFRHSTRTPVYLEPPELQSESVRGRTPEESAKNTAGIKRYVERVKLWVTSYQIVGGKPIKDCTWDDLEKSASARDVQISGMVRARDFELAVAEALPNKRITVGEALTPEKLNEIYRSVGTE